MNFNCASVCRAVLEIVARIMEKDTAMIAEAAFQNATHVFLKR